MVLSVPDLVARVKLHLPCRPRQTRLWFFCGARRQTDVLLEQVIAKLKSIDVLS